MDFVAFVVAAVAFVVGFGLGCVAYRAALKRSPERLEELADTIKRASESAGRRFE